MICDKNKCPHEDTIFYIKTIDNFLEVTRYKYLHKIVFYIFYICLQTFMNVYYLFSRKTLYIWSILCMTKIPSKLRVKHKEVTEELWPETMYFSVMWIQVWTFAGILTLIFSFSQVIPLRRKGRKEKEVSNRGEEKWQVHWDKSEKILLPSSKSKGTLFKVPALVNEWAKCPDEDLSAGS